jgi:hypothetical protein
VLTLTRHPDDRSDGAWCVGVAPSPPHYLEDGQVTRQPAGSGPPLCGPCALRHRDRTEGRDRGR